MEILDNIRNLLREKNLDAVLINSTNEFLAEYNSLQENSRYKLTNFSGSTGDAIVTEDNVFLLVDGRYHIQADIEVNPDIVTVIKLQTGETFFETMKKLLPEKSKLGMVAKKNSQARYEEYSKFFEVNLLDDDTVKPDFIDNQDHIENIDIKFTGSATDEKITKLTSNLGDDDAIILTNVEEVSYLFNIRDFSRPNSSSVIAKAIIQKNNAKYYTKSELSEFEDELKKIKGKIYFDKSSCNANDWRLAGGKACEIDFDGVKKMKSIKSDEEISHYIEAFQKTDLALNEVRDFIENNENISEFDISEKLTKAFKKFGARGLSFSSIVAKDKNSALAHYSKNSKSEILKNGSLILIDCGAYYDGGLATDITRVFVKGEPTNLMKQVYTTVLKAFLNCYNCRDFETGYDINQLALKIFDENKIEGFWFNHGLGHGIGVSVHECPPNLSKNTIAKVKIEENMCFTIEPGLYNENYFGVRLENSCYFKDGKINSFVKMNYEKKLINYDLLSEQEKLWLKEFEVK